MNNIEIRIEIEKSRFKKYEIAEAMGITETSFSRLLRKELSEQQKERVQEAIKKLQIKSGVIVTDKGVNKRVWE